MLTCLVDEYEVMFNKLHISRQKGGFGSQIEQLVSFLSGWISKKHTST